MKQVKRIFNNAIFITFSKIAKHILRIIIGGIQTLQSVETHLIIIGDKSNTQKSLEIQKRLQFYSRQNPNLIILWQERIFFRNVLSRKPILVFGLKTKWTDLNIKYRPGTFDVDFDTNPMDGWAWTDFSHFISTEKADVKGSQNRLIGAINALNNEKLSRCYVFGTGPSLSKANEMSWSDGVTIVCNTIVRDPQLWHHIEPDFIVAGDAIYHFGFTAFAKAFRDDLKKRLFESKTMFIYPEKFHSIIQYEFQGLDCQLIAIPTGWKHKIDIDLRNDFHLPNLGNVLGLLLLPLGCTISKNIYLFGFDGRAPDDKLFWSNSTKHSYPELIPELQNAHPKFFTHFVPVTDPNKYVRNVQGDQLDHCICRAEKNGWKFNMMHKSWTPTLNKRYHGE